MCIRDSFLYSIKCIRLCQDLLICAMIATTLFDETKHPLVTKVLIGTLVYTLFIWFIALVSADFGVTYECTRKIGLVISMSILIISMVSLYLFYTMLNTVKESYNYLESTMQKDQQQKLKIFTLDTLNARKEQVKIFTFCSLVSAFPLFVWDYLAYKSVQREEDCQNYYDAQSLFMTLIIFGLKLVSFILPPCVIYYVFYWRNKAYFQRLGDDYRKMSAFNELRSELIEY
eukprot:TRINITY_DN2640_c0_g1_i4.p2 TRINITY_DN2640_c0_g1~~TRINITY_DN2640_c0_g1_i4.p2  ORF type:complete len:230 (-),score=-0.97 TRINITY_DN2640_c0_g1_i4:9-698(-)